MTVRMALPKRITFVVVAAALLLSGALATQGVHTAAAGGQCEYEAPGKPLPPVETFGSTWS